MTEAQAKPEQFGIVIKGKEAHIKRHLEFGSGVIDLDINFTTTTPLVDMTVMQLHRASLRIAMQELQRLLDLSEQGQ